MLKMEDAKSLIAEVFDGYPKWAALVQKKINIQKPAQFLIDRWALFCNLSVLIVIMLQYINRFIPLLPNALSEAYFSSLYQNYLLNLLGEIANKTFGEYCQAHDFTRPRNTESYTEDETMDAVVGKALLDYETDMWKTLSEHIVTSFRHLPPALSPTVVMKQMLGPPEYLKAWSEFDRLQEYKAHIKYCFTELAKRNADYYGPFFLCVQSSGYGKTRTNLACCDEYYVLYLCLRPQNSSGEPVRSPVIADFILNDKSLISTSQWAILFACMLEVFYRIIKTRSPEADKSQFLLKEFIGNEKFVGIFWEEVISMYTSLLSPILEALKGETSSLEVKDRIEQVVFDGTKKNEYEECFKQHKILLVVDEIAPILEKPKILDEHPYVSMRRAFSLVNREYFPFLAVLLDTNSSVNALAPEQKKDPSARIQIGSSYVLPSYYSFPMELEGILENFPADKGLVTYMLPVLESSLPSTVIRVHFHPYKLISGKSRALFAAKAFNSLKNGPIIAPWKHFEEEQLRFAVQKLLCPEVSSRGNPVKDAVADLMKSSDFSNKDDIHRLRFTLACVRLYLSSVLSTDSQEMIRLHLATCRHISDDRETIVAKYPSEPIVAAAAQSIMLADQAIFPSVLGAVKDKLFDGLLLQPAGVGEIGELIGSIIFMRLFDVAAYESYSITHQSWTSSTESASIVSEQISPPPVQLISNMKLQNWQSNNYAYPMKLTMLLRRLYPNSYVVIENILIQQFPDLLYGLVYFTHFQKFEVDPSNNDLYECFARGSAIILKNGTTGVDLRIPIAIPINPAGTTVIRINDRSTYYMSIWDAQIKNYSKTKIYSRNIAEQMLRNPTYVELDKEHPTVSVLYSIIGVGPIQSSDLPDTPFFLLDRKTPHFPTAQTTTSVDEGDERVNIEDDENMIDEELVKSLMIHGSSSESLITTTTERNITNKRGNKTSSSVMGNFFGSAQKALSSIVNPSNIGKKTKAAEKAESPPKRRKSSKEESSSKLKAPTQLLLTRSTQEEIVGKPKADEVRVTRQQTRNLGAKKRQILVLQSFGLGTTDESFNPYQFLTDKERSLLAEMRSYTHEMEGYVNQLRKCENTEDEIERKVALMSVGTKGFPQAKQVVVESQATPPILENYR